MRRTAIVSPILLGIFLASVSGVYATETWTVSTFLEFSEGTLQDGGANTYVTAAGEIRLVSQSDLNDDGFLDIVFANTHDNNTQIDLFIYWGVDGFEVGQRTRLPSDGGQAQAIADLNRDGFEDLVVVNGNNGVKSNTNSYIYWGSQDGFDEERRAELPTNGATGAAIEDLNADGFLDLVFANSANTKDTSMKPGNYSTIYWGSKEGFSTKKLSHLPTQAATDVKIADLNTDGALDIVFSNQGDGQQSGNVMIYWGKGQEKYSEKRRTTLPGERSAALALADLDGDRFPDIVVANRYRPLKRDPEEKRELDTDSVTDAISSFIYWGSREGYEAARRTELPTLAAAGVAAGDLNGDGLIDLAFANGPQLTGHAAASAGAGSYVYWNSPQGFQAHRRSTFPTLNPQDCLIDDINNDGHQDLIFANDNDARSHRTTSYVYWGGSDGLDSGRRLDLQTVGAASIAAGDFDKDGKKDLVFINAIDGSAGAPIPAYIYWGNETGDYSVDQRSDLLHPYGSPAEGHATSDIDNDGYVDLFQGGAESAVYWGSKQGYSTGDKTLVSSNMSFSGLIADYNRDGYLDISISDFAAGGVASLHWGGPMGFAGNNQFIFQADGTRCQSFGDFNGDGYLDIVFPNVHSELVIYWNGPNGFDNVRKTILPAALTVATEVADLNRDGHLDIISCNLTTADGDYKAGTFIYWGSADGFSKSRRLVLPTVGNEDAAVADLNGDGHLDLVLTSYHAGETRSHPSSIYWNSDQGFDPERVTMMPTNSASGATVADYNYDGFPDILFSNHRLEGSHRNDSFLYWGGPDGFSPEHRTLLPGLGPHLLMVNDIGNIAHRGERYDYISRVFDSERAADFESLDWDGDTPFATGIEFQVRAAPSSEAIEKTPWAGPEGPGSYYRKHHSLLSGLAKDAQHFQFKASLISPNGANTPVLRSISVNYRHH